MADKKVCLGCGFEGKEVKFKLTVQDGSEELYCAECIAAVFENEPECVVKVEAI